jgi:hypothetical protein
MDIPQNKALERGQQLNKMHISHPDSPSIVLHEEDFNTACRLFHDMAAHPELQVDHGPTHLFKYKFSFHFFFKVIYLLELKC